MKGKNRGGKAIDKTQWQIVKQKKKKNRLRGLKSEETGWGMR